MSNRVMRQIAPDTELAKFKVWQSIDYIISLDVEKSRTGFHPSSIRNDQSRENCIYKNLLVNQLIIARDRLYICEKTRH